jgi:hypothetical protein
MTKINHIIFDMYWGGEGGGGRKEQTKTNHHHPPQLNSHTPRHSNFNINDLLSILLLFIHMKVSLNIMFDVL